VNEGHDPNESATVVSARELARLHAQIDEARQLLAVLQRDAFEAKSDRRRKDAAPMVEVNEQLVLSMLRTQVQAEASARDIAFRELTTELRLESQRLGEENRQLSETGRLKSQFLANMSHELRTPLNAIIGFSELLLSSGVSIGSPKCLEYLGHIHTSGLHLLHLIGGVLDVSKVASGKLDFHPEPVNLPQVFQEVVSMLQGAASRAAVVIRMELDSDVNRLVLDRTRLKQVVTNYLSNAIKFSRPAGVVTVRARAEGDDCFRVEVEDTGVGIAEADQARLFVEFQQIDCSNTRKHAGTGLGLALTRLLVEAQGGSVGVRSKLGAGSTFHFVLKRNTAGVPGSGGSVASRALAPAAPTAGAAAAAPPASSSERRSR
jgi:signal transduction histidine kinase